MINYLDAEPLHGNFSPFIELDQRSTYASVPLMIDDTKSWVYRVLTDLDSNPVDDFDVFSARVNALEHLTSKHIASAAFVPIFTNNGGVIVTEFVEGQTMNIATQGLRDTGIDKSSKVRVINPFNDYLGRICRYYLEQLSAGEPVVVDIIKSNQTVLGGSKYEGKSKPRLIDHDAHVVFGSDGEFDELDKLTIAHLVAAEAATLAIFLSNLGKSPEIEQPMLFGRVIKDTSNLLAWLIDNDFEPNYLIGAGLGTPIRAMANLLEETVQIKSIDNFSTTSMHLIVGLLAERRQALGRQKSKVV